MNLLKNIKISVIHSGDTERAATDVESTALVDMSGWDGVLLITSLANSSAGGTTAGFVLAPRHADNTTGPTSLGTTARATFSAITTGDWGKALAVDIYRPLKRYIGAHILKPTAHTSLVGPVYAIQYAGMKAPVTQVAAQVEDSKQCISPTT